ncbi:MAG: sensor histidine kinase [Chitinophagaceae bacterium]
MSNNLQKTLRLQTIVDGINAGVWDWQIQTGEEWWSDRFFQLLGYEPNEIPSTFEQFMAMLHPADVDTVNAAIEAHFAIGDLYFLNIRMRCKNGAYRWFETSGRVTFNAAGKPERMVGSLIDIHEKVLIQEKLEFNQFTLKETNKMVQAGGWVVSLLPEPTIHWSDEVYAIHEVPVGRQPSIEEAFNYYPVHTRPIIEQLFNNCIQYQTPFDTEIEFKTATNKIIWVRVMGKAVVDKAGQTIAVRGVFQNIDNIKKKEIALQRSIDVMAEQNKRLLNFAHIVSHNLRSHAANLESMLEMQRATSDPEEKYFFQQNIFKISASLNNTIQHLNEVVQIQTDLKKTKTTISFQTVFNTVIHILSANIQTSRTAIHADFSSCQTVFYNQAYLESILLNLLSNAIKYRQPNKPPEVFVTSSKSDDGQVYLTVKDNGVGIDLEKYGDRLFGMYETFHEHPDAKGIGLFITKNQVEAMGGQLTVESKLHEGTTFTVRF